MTEVDERVASHHADEVEEHDGREEVLSLELDGEEHDAELSSRILHAESAKNAKERATRAAAADEDLGYHTLILRKDRRPVLRKSRQHTCREEE
jgi:hypothetical protein